MYLAVNQGRLCTISEIATTHAISRHHLVKVAHRLSSRGFVKSVRGRGGGLELARAAEQIHIGSVVRATENDFNIVDCFHNSEACAIASGCRLKRVLDQATAAFLAVLDEQTIFDLTQRNPVLRSLFIAQG